MNCNSHEQAYQIFVCKPEICSTGFGKTPGIALGSHVVIVEPDPMS